MKYVVSFLIWLTILFISPQLFAFSADSVIRYSMAWGSIPNWKPMGTEYVEIKKSDILQIRILIPDSSIPSNLAPYMMCIDVKRDKIIELQKMIFAYPSYNNKAHRLLRVQMEGVDHAVSSNLRFFGLCFVDTFSYEELTRFKRIFAAFPIKEQTYNPNGAIITTTNRPISITVKTSGNMGEFIVILLLLAGGVLSFGAIFYYVFLRRRPFKAPRG